MEDRSSQVGREHPSTPCVPKHSSAAHLGQVPLHLGLPPLSLQQGSTWSLQLTPYPALVTPKLRSSCSSPWLPQVQSFLRHRVEMSPYTDPQPTTSLQAGLARMLPLASKPWAEPTPWMG